MIVERSEYAARGIWKNPYVQTTWANLLRKVPRPEYQREQWELEDGDFVDLDFVRGGHDRLCIVLPGLEGNYETPSVRSLVLCMQARSWDVLVINHRGCGGEVNRLLTSYHAGFIDDLRFVLEKMNRNRTYKSIGVAGLSMGGNILLKYLGNKGAHVPRKLKVAAAISAPVDLKSTVGQLMGGPLRLYQGRLARRIRKRLLEKVRKHSLIMPEKMILRMKSIRDVDRIYTAPIHGFGTAEDYWRRNSSRQYLKYIKVPTLLLSAADDPFLAGPSYPREEAKEHPALCLEIPAQGGHLGFVPEKKGDPCWHERRIAEFFEARILEGSK